jgi:hypothetical protein
MRIRDGLVAHGQIPNQGIDAGADVRRIVVLAWCKGPLLAAIGGIGQLGVDAGAGQCCQTQSLVQVRLGDCVREAQSGLYMYTHRVGREVKGIGNGHTKADERRRTANRVRAVV